MSEKKRCTLCGEEKPLSGFYWDKRGYHRSRCKVCWRGSDTVRFRRLGITDDAYRHMEKSQGGVCAICGRRNSDRSLSIDHCHDTGRIRGLLCNRCNTALGLLRDSPDIVAEALLYLAEPGAAQAILAEAAMRRHVTFFSWRAKAGSRL